MGEDSFPRFLDPDQLRQISERFPESSSALLQIPGAADFIRDMEATKAKAEVAFRQSETAEKWGELNLDEDPMVLVDLFARFGTWHPWRPAACSYIWAMASTYLRSPFADCKPEMFEGMVNMVINVYAERVYEEKLKPYEKKEWISYERSKAEFQEYVRWQLDPLVQDECLANWQQRLPPDSTNPESHNRVRTETQYVPRKRVASLRMPLSLREPREYSREWLEEVRLWFRNELGKMIGLDGTEATVAGDTLDSSVSASADSATVRATGNPPSSEVDVATVHAALAAERQAVIMPILKRMHWSRGKWAAKAGVGKNSIYGYLDGTRNPSYENRKAMADALAMKTEDLPD